MVSEKRECRWLGYEQRPIGYFAAVCSCGWKSDPYPTAGLAGTASDLHRAAGGTRTTRSPAAQVADAREEEHGFDRVEHGRSYTLVCTCGWRSTPSESAGDVGEQWDRHRAEQAGGRP